MTDEKNVKKIIAALGENGFSAYLVGGCVRDSIMKRDTHDIDIATSALPEDVIRIFGEKNTVPTGIKHGTVTVMPDKIPYEVTTFRTDGEYTDGRHPENVSFVTSIEEDLSRRDFTINAMAMNGSGEIIDIFGGREDISLKLVRCVGNPEKRFTEDALRILRAVRFASQLGFEIEENTAAAMIKLKENLANVSAERIRVELNKIICGKNCVKVMLEFREIIAQIIPEFRPCFDFDQHSHYHKYNVYEHIVRAVDASPADNLTIRRAMLFHDIGKPPMLTIDENGEGHFKGHPQLSAKMAKKIMEKLRYDNKSIAITTLLIDKHSEKIRTEQQFRHLAAEIGSEAFLLLMEVKKADNLAKQEFVADENPDFDRYSEQLKALIAENCCLSLNQLAVNGNDLINLGFRGSQIGKILNTLLNLVIDGEIPNDKQKLLECAAKEENL